MSLLASAAEAATTGTPLWAVVLVAAIAAVPGIIAGIVAARKASLDNHAAEGSVGVELTRVGADMIQEEITALRAERAQWTAERERWTEERERWHRERTELSSRIEELTYAVHRLVITLEQNKIPVPDGVVNLMRRSTDQKTAR